MAADNPHSLFNESFQRYLKSKEQTKLMIIVLGPTKGSSGHEKRIQIRDHLRSTGSTDDVAFPEELDVPEEALPDDDIWPGIDFIIVNAQIIFALLIDETNVTGVLTEVSRHYDKKGFRDKSFLILPKKRRQTRGGSLPLIWVAADAYPKDRTLRYSEDEFRSCVRIRDYVAAKVNVYRKRLRWDEFMKEAGMTTFEYS